METVEHAPGRLADLFGDSTRSTALVWHGRQSDDRAVIRPLAERLARRGIAPWCPTGTRAPPTAGDGTC
ncbi:hypothetical protein [Mycobacterium sp. URHB0021]